QMGHPHARRGRDHGADPGRRLAGFERRGRDRDGLERYAEEIARDFDPESQVKAMDKEGLDLAILYPTAGMYATAFTHMDPRFAAAVCRAYNDWLYDYIRAADPKRLFGAACVSPHDVAGAVAETRRAVLELGMKAIFLRPNIYTDKPWH